MPKATKPGFYAVARGRVPGVYKTWCECQAQINGFAGNKHQKFPTIEQANAYLADHGAPLSTASVASSSTSNAPASHGNKPYARPASSGRPSSHGRQSASSRWMALTNEIIQDESGWNVVYSDGACKGNGQVGSVAGIGVWWGQNDPRNIAERCPGAQTNNRAELIAIARVLETTPHSKLPLLIKTDSKYSISCFREWMPKWLKNKFISSTGQPVKNAPLIRYLSALLDVRARRGQKVHLQYVKGHAGEEGNEGADQLANIGATLPEQPEHDWDALIDGLENVTHELSTAQKDVTLGALSQTELEAYAASLVDDDTELLAEVKAL